MISKDFQGKLIITLEEHGSLTKIDGEFKGIKAADLPIMDLASTGSSISKKKIETSFVVAELIEAKMEDPKEATPKVEEVKEAPKEEPEELTIDDFIDDFKL